MSIENGYFDIDYIISVDFEYPENFLTAKSITDNKSKSIKPAHIKKILIRDV